MSAKTVPSIPPRPSRSPHSLSPPKGDNVPKIPPRPARRPERSVSPLRGDRYAPSPLNEMPGSPGLSRTTSAGGASGNPIPRPPSVTMPTLGQEGSEYEEVERLAESESDNHIQQPAETRNVNKDLHLHAPRPSLPTSSANARVQAVTRTDSHQAAAAGFGKVKTSNPDDERTGRPTHARASGSPHGESSIASSDRRASQHWGHDDSGIPEIGQRVPMYPNAGDVQAPSPAPYGAGHVHPPSASSPGRPGRRHDRSRSRDVSLPPGSYGLHGHGAHSHDRFEKAWYDKHPDELAREEQGLYGPGLGTPRPEWAMSSDELNKIVRSPSTLDAGLGAHAELMGTPEEQVGYIAGEELAHRMYSPPPLLHGHREDSTQPAVESPLRNASGPEELAVESKSPREHEHGKPEVIHIDEPLHHENHPDGFAPAPEDHHHHGHGAESPEEGHEEEEEPILAADEGHPGAEHMQPAISPTFERRESGYFDNHDIHGLKGHSRSSSAHGSRPTSRPTSFQGGVPSLPRFNSRGDEHEDLHTPLEDVEEYEPLFPEGEDKEQADTAAERFKKRPEHGKQRFPSRDIWEDTPDSLQLEATVSTPEVPEQTPFETPEQEHARSHTAASRNVSAPLEEQLSHLDDEKPQRPDGKHRFPSRDIWEEAPESQQLVTTVQTPEQDEKEKPTSPEVPAKPSIPARPAKRSEEPGSLQAKKPPTIPDRPKPQVPSRPAKPVVRTSDDSLTKTVSGGSNEATSPPAVKPKPAIPARPMGSKIAALQAGFMTDLNKRLKAGPQEYKPQEKKEEAEAPVEKGPLSDARKGRAKGPARRKPAVQPAKSEQSRIPEIRIVDPWNVWQVGEDGVLVVGEKPSLDTRKASTDSVEKPSSTESPPASEERPEQPTPRPLDLEGDSIDTALKSGHAPECEEPAVAGESTSSSTGAQPTPAASSVDGQAEAGEPSEPAEENESVAKAAPNVVSAPGSEDTDVARQTSGEPVDPSGEPEDSVPRREGLEEA